MSFGCVHDGTGWYFDGVGGPQVVGAMGVQRLTAATLPAAETAPMAREDWRTALRNILEEVSEGRRRKENNCSEVQLGEGRLRRGLLPLQRAIREILQERVLERRN